MASHGTSHGFVGVDMATLEEKIFEAVRKHDKITGQRNHQGAVLLYAPHPPSL